MDSMIFPKLHIYPIILPLMRFKDLYNNFNAYFQMNPSMHIDDEGNVIILVRNINYRIFSDNDFIIYNHPCDSVYFIMRGKITPNEPLDVEKFQVEPMIYDYQIPKYSTYWSGMEDIRFINSTSILAVIPECNKGGKPSIFKGTITGNTIHSLTDCYPNIKEKNWMPFMDKDGKDSVIYSLHPFIIKSVENDDGLQIQFDEMLMNRLKDFHGSTNGIEYKEINKRLFLIHAKKMGKIIHRWLLYDILNHVVYLSKEFVFFTHSYIEFPVSLSIFHGKIFVSLGVNDNKAFIIEVLSSDIDAIFE